MCKLALLKKLSILYLLLYGLPFFAQKKDTIPFNRKEEIVYDDKRYRKYNNYLSFGMGKGISDIRRLDQNFINVDYQFHLQREYFQAGLFMSGDDFLRNNNIQGHICYGIRREGNKYNFAGFIGPSYSYFVTGKTDTAGVTTPVINNILGGYLSLQGIYKIKYDVGIGLELFADVSTLQRMAGVRVILFFSGAYRGVYRGFKTKPK